MIKVSVIVPVYNGERHLKQCMDSICGQTLKEIEIICVNDGSTDSSCDILEGYRENDDRIKIYHQDNLSCGAARNTGKAHAVGEYLVFWDCDDFFEPEALELMYERAKEYNADICVCGGNQYLENKGKVFPAPVYMNVKRIPEAPVFNRLTNEDYILNFTNVPVWNKLYKRSFVEREGLDFQQIRQGEDIFFTMHALCLAERITTIEKPLVNYRKNQKQSQIGNLSKAPFASFQAWIDTALSLQSRNAFPERSFANVAMESIIFFLRNLPDRQAFLSVVDSLQKEGLDQLHIREREEGYYYKAWYDECVKHLRNDTPEDFQTYLAYVTYIQFTGDTAEKRLLKQKNEELQKELKSLKAEIGKLKKEKEKSEEQKNSWFCRIGNITVRLPGKIRRGGKRNKK